MENTNILNFDLRKSAVWLVIIFVLAVPVWWHAPQIAAKGLRYHSTHDVSFKIIKFIGPRAAHELVLFAGGADGWYETLDEMVCRAENNNIERWLLVHNKRAYCWTGEGKTLLHYAAKNGCTQLVKDLIKGGASVNAGFPSRTPLTYLAHTDYVETARVLLENGADTTAIAYVGMEYYPTSLHIAAMNTNSTAMLELLIEFGADVNSDSGSNGKTPLSVAKEANNTQAIEILLAHGAK